MDEENNNNADGVGRGCWACEAFGRWRRTLDGLENCDRCYKKFCIDCAPSRIWKCRRCRDCFGSVICVDCAEMDDSIEACMLCARKAVCAHCADDCRLACPRCDERRVKKIELREGRTEKTQGSFWCLQCEIDERPELVFDCACLKSYETREYCNDVSDASLLLGNRAAQRETILTSALWIEATRFCDASTLKSMRLLSTAFRGLYWDFAHNGILDESVALKTRQEISDHRRCFRLLRDLDTRDATTLLKVNKPLDAQGRLEISENRSGLMQPRLYAQVHSLVYWRTFIDEAQGKFNRNRTI